MMCTIKNNPSLCARYGDREYPVTAICTTAAEANAFIAANPSHEVIAALGNGEFILLADKSVAGVKVTIA